MLPDGLCASLPVALLGSLLLGAIYVGVLYIFTDHQRRDRRAPDRDDPRVIRERFLRVGIACLVSPPVALLVAALPGGSEPCTPSASLWQWFGLAPRDLPTLLAASVLPLALTMVLFCGPLLMAWVDRDDRTPLKAQLQAFYRDADLRTVRNLVVGPISEEWVFRACMCSLLFGAGLSDAACVFTSGALFGLAHVHHVFDAGASWIAVAVQFTYTSLFGAYSSYLFMRTGLVYGPVLAHAFCNCMGLPDFGRAAQHPKTLGAATLGGLLAFIALCTADAVRRPLLFHSLMWSENP